jgi:hypothetical protein
LDYHGQEGSKRKGVESVKDAVKAEFKVPRSRFNAVRLERFEL